MTVSEFVNNFISTNSIVRLVEENESGHNCLLDSWSDVSMAWELSTGKGKFAEYKNAEFVSVISILVNESHGRYPDAINIKIKRA